MLIFRNPIIDCVANYFQFIFIGSYTEMLMFPEKSSSGQASRVNWNIILCCRNFASFFRYLATTQFEANHARRAFPCFDEPSFKATFNITLLRRDFPFRTISNMPMIRTESRYLMFWKAGSVQTS